MTLILSTICKNGLCVCADKRSTNLDGTFEDNLDKLYRFDGLPLIIFNHGVNKFNNKKWRDFCLEYNKSNRWNGLNLNDIWKNFRKFIEDDIRKELEKNFNDKLPEEFLKSFFVFCGKGSRNTKFKAYELCWSFCSGELEFKPNNKLRNLIISGKGGDYLKNYLDNNPQINSNNYWSNLDMIQAKKELQELFKIAAKEKNSLGKNEFKNEFSDDFDTKCIPDNSSILLD